MNNKGIPSILKERGKVFCCCIECQYKEDRLLFVCPIAGRSLYVTDKYKKSVIGITMEGDKRWECTYHGLKNPRGIAVYNNRIYVAGCRSHSVVLMNTDGEIIGDIIIEGISFPNKICLSPRADRLLVTQFQGTLIDIERNTVKIYRLD